MKKKKPAGQSAGPNPRGQSGQAPENIDNLTPESLRAILHELRGRQIDLEIQNEELRRAQADLEAARARYFDLYDLAPVAYLTVSGEGLILEANLTAASMLGMARQALIKLPFFRIICNADQDLYYKHRKLLFETGDPQRCDLRMVKPGGATFWTCLESTLAMDEAGAPLCRITFSDITKRKQMEMYRGMDRDVLRILNESGDRRDFIGRVLATLKERTGFDAVGIRLEDGEDFPYFAQEGFPGYFLLTENSLVERAPDGSLCRDKDGKARLECTCGLVLSGKTDPSNPLFSRGGSCWTNDVTPTLGFPPGEDPRNHSRNLCVHFGYASVAHVPIRSQDRITGLIQFNDRRKGCFTPEILEILEGIAWHIGEALLRKKTEDERNEALLRAETATRAKTEFLGVMSHELRTPLNGVLGFTDLLMDTPLDDEQKSFVTTISASGEHLLAIVNDILDFSSFEHGSLALQATTFGIGELVEPSIASIRRAAGDKGIGFRCDVAPGVPDQITGDARRIRQILINLLGNALKFTQTGSLVFRIAPDQKGRFLEFSVEDTGIGISPETLPLLFKPFSQANSSTSRRFGGTGLGLAISKRLAEAMGGSIDVHSTPGIGSTFTFRLPLPVSFSASRSAAADPGAPASSRASGATVLVVDDEKNSTTLAGVLLRSLGYRVEFAADGAEAVKAFKPGKFYAIFMDMAMPVMDGLEATAKIREIETGPPVPIIALTANVLPGDRERCLAAGMDDFLAKPFKRDQLAAKLEHLTEVAVPAH